MWKLLISSHSGVCIPLCVGVGVGWVGEWEGKWDLRVDELHYSSDLQVTVAVATTNSWSLSQR